MRLAAVEHATRLAVAKPSLAPPILKALEERVRDSNDKVRTGVVEAVCAAADGELNLFAPILATLAARMGDKRPNVRKAARDGLAALYKTHTSAHLQADGEAKTVPDELHCIPQQLLHFYGVDAGHDVSATPPPSNPTPSLATCPSPC